ncbi:MAG: ABC transporter substrate-binding protein [Haloarculaceae archaeon]
MSTSARTQREQSGTVELVHFWEEGDGRRMLDAVLAEFDSRHPEVNVEDRSYSNHGLAIKSRILRENPPSLFVEWPDRNLEPYDQAGALRDLTPVWEDNGWFDAFIEGPRESLHVGDRYVGVPVDLHRMNNLFYRVGLVEELGVDPSRVSDPREFLEVLRQCEDAGVVGMEQPMRDPSDVLQLLTNVFIGQFGAEAFAELTRERPAARETELEEALRLLEEYSRLASDDAYFLDMVAANDRFVDGDSVFFHQGDWMAGEYADVADFDYGTGWGHAVFPGTEGVYTMGGDAVVAAADAEFGPAARTFLEFVGSPEALELLNRVKGSIPPRRDISLDSYPEFLQEQFADFERARHFPASHALQVSPEAFVEAKAAISDFIAERDVQRTTRDLVEAYSLGVED